MVIIPSGWREAIRRPPWGYTEGHHVNFKTAETTSFLFTLGPCLALSRPSNMWSNERNWEVKSESFLARLHWAQVPLTDTSFSETQVFPRLLLFPKKQVKADGAIVVIKVSVASKWLHLAPKVTIHYEEVQALFHSDVRHLVDMKSLLGIQT